MGLSDAAVSFSGTDDRRDEMHNATDRWLDDIVNATESARASEAFYERPESDCRIGGPQIL